MTPSRSEMTPQLLRSLPGAPAEMARALATAHEADVAEALSQVAPAVAAEVLSAFPFEFAVRVLEHPEFERRHEIFRHFATDKGVAFIRAMAPDQQARIFRELPEGDRARFLEELDAGTRATLALLLAYPPATAGSIMTTEYVSIPSTWTVGEALSHIAQVGRRKPVYAIYVLNPDDRRLVHVVSLRDLVLHGSGGAGHGHRRAAPNRQGDADDGPRRGRAAHLQVQPARGARGGRATATSWASSRWTT